MRNLEVVQSSEEFRTVCLVTSVSASGVVPTVRNTIMNSHIIM